MDEKVYKGKNFKKIIEKIKKDLGEDALIHSTKIIEKKNILPLFKKRIFEIKASKESKNINPNSKDVPYFSLEDIRNYFVLNNYTDLYNQLIENEIDPILAKSMIINFSIKINPNTLPNKRNEYMKEMIKKFFKECLPELKSKDLNKISIFLGPTGVGKTLSIIKIAADLLINKNEKVSVVSIDFYKIGGEEQLKKYAEILKLPYEFSFNPSQFKRIIDIYSKENNYIFIDTPGISPNNKELISQIQNFLIDIDINKILLVPSYASINELYYIWENYKDFKIDELGITKLDEAKTKGHILKFLIDIQTPVRFITFGVKIPEDIKLVDNEILISNLLGW